VLHRHDRGTGDRDRRRDGADHAPDVPGAGARAREHPGAVGDPDRGLRAAVAVDLPGGRRRERGAAPADPVDRRRVPRQDGRRHRRGLEDLAVHRAAGARGPADDPPGRLRGGAGGRRRPPPAVLAHHAAAGEARPAGGGAVPHAGCAADVRPARRADRRQPEVRGDPHDDRLVRGVQPAVRIGGGVRDRPVPVHRAARLPVREAARRRHHRRGPPAHPRGAAGRAEEGGRVSGSLTRRTLAYLGFALVALYCLAPFYWMTISAFRRPQDQFDNTIVPVRWSAENFTAVFSGGNGFGRALLNSLIVAGATTVLTLLIGTVTAYALARLDFRFKNAVLGLIIATTMFPGIS